MREAHYNKELIAYIRRTDMATAADGKITFRPYNQKIVGFETIEVKGHSLTEIERRLGEIGERIE